MAESVWQAVTLSERAEGYAVNLLERAMRRIDPDTDIWFPAVTDEGVLDAKSPYSSYVFVRYPAAPSLPRVWCVDAIVPGEVLERDLLKSLKTQPPLKPSTPIRVITGDLTGVEGTVRRVNKGTVFMDVILDSGTRTIPVPRTSVERL